MKLIATILRSRTIVIALMVTILGALQITMQLITNTQTVGILLIIIGVIQTYLRLVTTGTITDNEKKKWFL